MNSFSCLYRLASRVLGWEKALNAAELRLQACKERLNELQSMFDNQMAEKKRIEDGAMALQRKMNQVLDPNLDRDPNAVPLHRRRSPPPLTSENTSKLPNNLSPVESFKCR